MRSDESLTEHFNAIKDYRDTIAFNGVGQYPADDARLLSILNAENFSAAFHAHVDSATGKMLQWFDGRSDLGSTALRWAAMDGAAQLAWQRLPVDAFLNALSVPGVTTPSPELEWRSGSGVTLAEAVTDWRDLDGQHDRIRFFDGDLSASRIDFIACTQDALHESFHIFKGALSRAWLAGSIPPEHPLAGDAHYTAKRQQMSAYIPSALEPFYLAQPEERCAYQISDRIEAHLQRILPPDAAIRYRLPFC